MSLRASAISLLFVALASLAARSYGDTPAPYSGAACAAPVDEFFTNEVWPKVGARTCLECHKPDGDAEDSDFVLRDLDKVTGGPARDEALRHDRDAFAKMARLMEGDQSRMLLKVTGHLKHGGKQVLKPESTGYAVLAEFVRRVKSPPVGRGDREGGCERGEPGAVL